ncbi:hypothetical protein ACNFR7_16090 [Streptomyces sp. RM1]
MPESGARLQAQFRSSLQRFDDDAIRLDRALTVLFAAVAMAAACPTPAVVAPRAVPAR